MTKESALTEFGPDVVYEAMSMYETDFYKIFFQEDVVYAEDCVLDSERQQEYLWRAKHKLERSIAA